MKQIELEDLRHVATGAAILGAGGGGDPRIGRLMAEQAIKEHGPVQLISPDELADDDLIIPSAMMGAPAVMLEKLPSGAEPEVAFRALERYLGKKAAAVLPIEAGGLNSCIPIYTAAVLGLPLLDADGMGRAFPELPMVSFSIGGVAATPMVVCDEKGNIAVIETIDNPWSEVLARTLTVAMGLAAMIAIYPMNGKQLKSFAIRGTISLAREIGRTIAESNRSQADPIDALCKTTKGYRLFTGKIVDVTRDLTTGFVRGTAKLQGIDTDESSTLYVDFQNENLVARRDDQVLAMTPDLITLVDAETTDPVTTEHLRYGRRVHVLGMPCDEIWRRPEGIALVGPRYFGYDIDYTPIESAVGGGRQ
jgi:hypothetical protein